MKVIKLVLFSATGTTVVCVYAVAPVAVSLRPLLGGFLLPVLLAFAIIGLFAVRILTILRRTVPFAEPSGELLSLPVLDLPVLERDGQPTSGPAGNRTRPLHSRALLPLPPVTITESYNVTP